MPDTYRVSVRDINVWSPAATGLALFAIRPVLLQLYARGFTPMSVQVRAETHDRTAKRRARGDVALTRNPYPRRTKKMLEVP